LDNLAEKNHEKNRVERICLDGLGRWTYKAVVVYGYSFPLEDTLHATLTHLLIFVVLSCPFLCRGVESSVSAPTCESHCCKCSETKSPADDQTPSPTNGSDSDCFCQGAIFDGRRPVDIDEAAPPVIARLFYDSVLPIDAIAVVGHSFESPHQFPPLSTGRDVCTLKCALLL